MSDTDSLSTDTLCTAEEVITLLEDIICRVEKGCIVKIAIEDLFSPVTVEQKSYNHIYGIVDKLANVCLNSGLRCWTVEWFIIYETILPEALHGLSYLMDQLETDLNVVNWPDDSRMACGEDFRLACFCQE